MISLLASIPHIIATVNEVAELFDGGRDAVKSVTGKESTATTVEQLQKEISVMDPAQAEAWANMMAHKIEKYVAETERLIVEQGTVPTNLKPEDAARVAIMRQTTRPWVVRMCTHFFMIPAYLLCVDIIQGIVYRWFLQPFGVEIETFPAFAYVFGHIEKNSTLVETIFVSSTTFSNVYEIALPFCTGVILTYMGLREYGKNKGMTDNPNLPDTIRDTAKTGTHLFNAVSKILGKTDKRT